MLKNACRELGFEIDIDYFTIDMEVGIRRPWLKEICNEQEN